LIRVNSHHAHNDFSNRFKGQAMNATERDQLQQFLTALRQTRAEPKDPMADDLIRQAVASQTDAPYLLVQRAMGLGMALDAAQIRIQQLEAQCAQQQALLQATQAPAPASSGFLMSGSQAWGRGAETPAVPPIATANKPMPSPAASSPALAAQPGASPWGGGLMAQMATTAAGVVAGGLLFQGVQSLMGRNTPAPQEASPLSSAQEEPLPGQVSPSAEPADVADAGDASWDQGEDWA
jgi:hypothetical protein